MWGHSNTMQNDQKMPKEVVDEFTNALNDHEKELRKQMTHHLDHLEGQNGTKEAEQNVHHIDVSDSGMDPAKISSK